MEEYGFYLAHAIINGMYVTAWGPGCIEIWAALIEAFGANTPVIKWGCSLTQAL